MADFETEQLKRLDEGIELQKKFGGSIRTLLAEQRRARENSEDRSDEGVANSKKMIANQAAILGISKRRLKSIDESKKQIEDQKEVLRTIEETARKQGLDVSKIKGYDAQKAKLDRMEQRQQLRTRGILPRLLGETKLQGRRLQAQFKKYFGFASPLTKGISALGGFLTAKVTSGVSSIFGLLAKGAFVASLFVLNKFLQSETWKNLKEDLIPKLEKGLEKLKASLKRITDAFFGEDGSFFKGLDQILIEVFGDGDEGFGASLRRVLDQFLGPDGSFAAGVKQIMKEIFGENYEEAIWYKALVGLKNLFVTIAKGTGAILKVFTTEGWGGEDGKWATIKENWKEILVAAGALVLAFRRPIFKLLGVAAGLSAMASSVSATAAPVGTKIQEGKFKGAKVGDIVEGKGGKKLKITGASKTGKAMVEFASAKDAAAAAKGATSFIQKYPRLLKATKAIPFLGTLLTTGMGAMILMSDASKDEKITQLGVLLGGVLGAAGFSTIGAAVGTVVMPGLGTAFGGVLGGLAGFLGGEAAGKKLMSVLMNGGGEEQNLFDAPTTPVDDLGATSYGEFAKLQKEQADFSDAYAANMNMAPATDTQIANAQRTQKINGAGSYQEFAMMKQNVVADNSVKTVNNATTVQQGTHYITNPDPLVQQLTGLTV